MNKLLLTIMLVSMLIMSGCAESFSPNSVSIGVSRYDDGGFEPYYGISIGFTWNLK